MSRTPRSPRSPRRRSASVSERAKSAAVDEFVSRVERLESAKSSPPVPALQLPTTRASKARRKAHRDSARKSVVVSAAGAFRQVIATYAFEPAADAPESAGQLAFRKGDLILVTDESEQAHGWLEGVIADRQGWFPANRVERIRQRPLLVALYDLDPKRAGYLAFRAGDVITLRQTFPSWFEGELDGVVGLVPANFVKPLVTNALADPSAPLPAAPLKLPHHAHPAAAPAAAAAEASSADGPKSPTPQSPTLRSRGKRVGVASPRTGRVYHSSRLPPVPFVKVRVVRGRRLPTPSSVPPDSYVDVAIDDMCVTSDVARHTTAPEWHATFFVPVGGCALATTHMKVQVSHARADSGDDLIGTLSIPLLYFRERRTRAAWFPLQARAARGDVRLRLLYEVDGGTLNVDVIEGRGFIDSVGANAYASPFVQCDVGEFSERTAATQSVATPHWNHKMRVPSARARDDLVLSAYDASDTRARSDNVRAGFIGDMVLPLALLVPGQALDGWFTLTCRDVNTAHGDIYLAVDWVE